MQKRRLVLGLLLVALVLVGCGAPNVDWTLSVTGAVDQPLTLTYRELSRMPQEDLNEILMERTHGEDSIGDWSGVPLRTLLTEAEAHEGWVSITALATDGYAVEVSREELDGAIVALKEQGEWITKGDPEHGPIRLVCPLTPADRWVFQLTELQVNAP
ncbi:MAG: molybdopterin-dependent oxidoreductase [Anaerolineae bacterium]|nr:molybdopterin-dependent oxidoreductase [Anaerolineae bacterium]